jgi:predicted nuclease with RNAse H fold
MAKRGVKSYPCLIPSMQRLTLRGIYLGNEFRMLGCTVIESYPGAAQDILGIPRKRKSMEYLIKGLQSFGIKGVYDRKGITHDEIDAITAALVGYFYLAGKYERLGNEKEGYLIIPDIEAKP